MNSNTPPYDTGVIHGRFQILHNDHLKYLLAGKELCRHLVVGITNPDPSQVNHEASDPLRSSDVNNPLTYYERLQLVRNALASAGVSSKSFSIVPLPINTPERYKYYVPMDAVFFLSIYDDWGRQKKSYFESMGLTVHVLWEVTPSEKGISAGDVRDRMMRDEPWEHLVPANLANFLKKWNVAARLKDVNGL